MADMADYADLDDDVEELIDDIPYSQVQAWLVFLEERRSILFEPMLRLLLVCRDVITAYFDEKGLVRQQLDSFDQFLLNTIEEVLEDTAPLQIKPQQQYTPGTQISDVGSKNADG